MGKQINAKATLTISTEMSKDAVEKSIKGLEARLSKLTFNMDNASAKKAAKNLKQESK